jgi:integrase
VRAILTCAIESDHITRNVAKQTKLPTVRKPKRRAWTSAEARQFLEYTRLEDERFYAAHVLVLVLGLRKGEVLGLAWDQIDFERGELIPTLQVQRVGKQLLRREVKSETSEQPLPLPDICLNALARHRRVQEAIGTYDDQGLLFTTATGRPVEPRNFNRFWDRQVAGCGVRRITVHDARRTCATILRDLKVHPSVAQRILRHAQVSITLDVYTEVTDDATREALRQLGEALE